MFGKFWIFGQKHRQFLGNLNIRIISSLFPNPSYKYLRVVAPVQVYPPKQ